MRDRLVQTRLTHAGWEAAEARSARVGLALGAWLALVGEDVALGRPALGGELFARLAAAVARVDRAGKSLNLLATGENIGRAIPEAQVTAALGAVDTAVGLAVEVLDEVAAVYAAADGPVGGEVPGAARGKRAATTGAGVEVRGRRVSSWLTAREYQVLAGAAARDGLTVGAWMGAVAEAQVRGEGRQAITGEQFGAVVRVRKSLRRVAWNVAQIEQARARRGAAVLPELVTSRVDTDAAIRAAFEVESTIAGLVQVGVAA